MVIVRVVLTVYALACLAACVTSQPVTIPLVALNDRPSDVKILQQNVTATDCPDPGHMYGSFNDAIEMAIAQVQGANALVNVKFDQKDTFGHYCMRVTGDAVAL
ncbi:MAG: hypothetical protein ACR2QG_12425 [Gammaproteobacteria bacterium]